MAKFKIIEESRLKRSELADSTGGDRGVRTCGNNPIDYYIIYNCQGGGVSYASCYNGYTSCMGSSVYGRCPGNYGGPIGPGGDSKPINPELGTPGSSITIKDNIE